MGMDVYGLDPSSEVGRYFRTTGHGWGVVWDFAEWTSPELAAKVRYAYTCDRDGLGDADSKALAASLMNALASGRLDLDHCQYSELPYEWPTTECPRCGRSGRRGLLTAGAAAVDAQCRESRGSRWFDLPMTISRLAS